MVASSERVLVLVVGQIMEFIRLGAKNIKQEVWKLFKKDWFNLPPQGCVRELELPLKGLFSA